MTDKILRRKDVEAHIGLSRSTIYQAISEGSFPKPIRIGRRAVGWPLSVIEDWLANRPLSN
ncbi:MAG: AlpA family phage regulatory protein [Sphingopyxis sp.]